jgi:hypothetical protein
MKDLALQTATTESTPGLWLYIDKEVFPRILTQSLQLFPYKKSSTRRKKLRHSADSRSRTNSRSHLIRISQAALAR